MYEDLPLYIEQSARKVIVNKFQFFVGIYFFVRLLAAMACENLIFPPQKLNSDDTLQRDTGGLNTAFSHWIP